MISALSKDGREVRAGVFAGGTNAAGAVEMGFHPEYLPGLRRIDDVRAKAQVEAVWSASVAAKAGLAGSSLLCSAAHGEVKALSVMGADPASRSLTPEEREGLKRLECLVVTTDRMTKTAEMAHVVFPAAAFWEKTGSLTNVAVRVQRFEAAVPPPPGGSSRTSISWFLWPRRGACRCRRNRPPIWRKRSPGCPNPSALFLRENGKPGHERAGGLIHVSD